MIKAVFFPLLFPQVILIDSSVGKHRARNSVQS